MDYPLGSPLRYAAGDMGNREALIAGALHCLMERGWARTTVRDIAAAAGVNHAAIGYHFGSKDALLAAAIVESMEAWSTELAQVTTMAGDPDQEWQPVLEWMAEHRSVLLANLDVLAQAQRSPEMLDHVAAVHEKVRRSSAAWVTGATDEAVTENTVRGLGSVYMALISGLAIQAIVDPDRMPSGADIVAGVRALAAVYEANHERATEPVPGGESATDAGEESVTDPGREPPPAP